MPLSGWNGPILIFTSDLLILCEIGIAASTIFENLILNIVRAIAVVDYLYRRYHMGVVGKEYRIYAFEQVQ